MDGDAGEDLTQLTSVVDAALAMARAAGSGRDLEETLVAAIRVVAEGTSSTRAGAYLLDEGTRSLVLRAVHPRDDAFVEGFQQMPVGSSLTGGFVGSVRASARHARDTGAFRDRALAFGLRQIAFVPLHMLGRSAGVLILGREDEDRPFTTRDLRIAEILAELFTVYVDKAKLYEELRRSYVDLEHAQEQLVKRERLAAIGQLAATLAHELRNPLGVLFNSISTLSKTLPAEGDSATLLVIMQEEGGRLDRLVRELLEFARPRQASLETESLRDVVRGAVDAAARELGPEVAKVVTELPLDLPPVKIDASMIRRAVVNLVVNAVQASPDAETVVVRGAVELHGAREVARLDVIDAGAGMSKELAARVFEPFVTTKATGTGLGLAVVKSIVDSHGGEIRLTSAPGAGTMVTLLLPLDGPRPLVERGRTARLE